MTYVQSCAEKKDCFAKHQPGVAGSGWLQPGRNFSLNLAPFLLLNPVDREGDLLVGPCKKCTFSHRVLWGMQLSATNQSGWAGFEESLFFLMQIERSERHPNKRSRSLRMRLGNCHADDDHQSTWLVASGLSSQSPEGAIEPASSISRNCFLFRATPPSQSDGERALARKAKRGIKWRGTTAAVNKVRGENLKIAAAVQ